MDKYNFLNDIEITFWINSKDFSKAVEEIIADFKYYLPDFKSDSTNILFMFNKEKKRKLMYFLNRFTLNVGFSSNQDEQIEFIHNTIRLINNYTVSENVECRFEFSFFTKYDNNSFDKRVVYPSSSNKLEHVVLDTLGFTVSYNEEDYDIWVYEGELEDKDNELTLPGFMILVNHKKEINKASEWKADWIKLTQELPDEIVTFLMRTFI